MRVLLCARGATTKLLCRAASGRHVYVKDGSNAMPKELTEEVRDLMRHQRHAENVADWRRELGLGAPVRLDMSPEEDVDDDQVPDIEYTPHKNDDFHAKSANFQPSPVLLARRVKTLCGEPHYHKDTLTRLRMGRHLASGQWVALPNVPSICLKLFTVKHLVEIRPVRFPQGLPPLSDHFDARFARVNEQGHFFYTPVLKVDHDQAQEGERNAKNMLMSTKTITRRDFKHWFHPWRSPFGNDNYHRDTKWSHPELRDHASDPKYKAKFHEDRLATDY